MPWQHTTQKLPHTMQCLRSTKKKSYRSVSQGCLMKRPRQSSSRTTHWTTTHELDFGVWQHQKRGPSSQWSPAMHMEQLFHQKSFVQSWRDALARQLMSRTAPADTAKQTYLPMAITQLNVVLALTEFSDIMLSAISYTIWP